MSKYPRVKQSLAGIDIAGLDPQKLGELFRRTLEEGIHGICFSPYVAGQGPGTSLGEEQIGARLDVVAPFVSWIRSFSCTEGHELTPALAKARGLKTMVGVWLNDDRDNNEIELANGVEVARNGHADILAIGNEVLLRGELSASELIEYIERAREMVPGVTVGYVDAYFLFEDHPTVTAACDIVLANCYPYWEGCPAEHALLYMKEMHRRALRAARGKPVIISETGWPNTGSSFEGATPTAENAIKYFVDTYRWAADDEIPIFYFSAFDETWKIEKEGDVGACWGLWDADGKIKYG